jgi:murein DD-endopeptidase MepM/ murein hydrolase activator NlpD
MGCATLRLPARVYHRPTQVVVKQRKSSADFKREARVGLLDPKRPLVVFSGKFIWPVKSVKVTSMFGQRGREFHDGIDLHAPKGTPVVASHAGTVLYAGSGIRGYGKLVVLRHEGSLATLYAHNSSFLVKRGEQVKVGQRIALSGATGHVRGPHVHFELRQGITPLNPLKFLATQEIQRSARAIVKSDVRRKRRNSG